MKIKVSSPAYDYSNEIITINLLLESGAHSSIQIDFSNLLQFAAQVSHEVVDFFILSACTYGIDRFIERKSNSVDGWSRDLSIEVPVFCVEKWGGAKNELESCLSFLTGDYWKINFYKTQFEYPHKDLEKKFESNFSQVNLFSGGLDSLIGTIDFLESNPSDKLLLTSHYDREMSAKKDQNELLNKLSIIYEDRIVNIPSVGVTLAYSSLKKETTFRSRSILFIGMALLAAQTKNLPIVVPENGSVSLNYPLSTSRRSSCSTRTTHPTFLEKVRILWAKIGINTDITNPYEFHTKGEMVSGCNQKVLTPLIEISNSCGKRGHRINWEMPSASHCGICMPCTYRRASLQYIKDNSTYGNTINKKSVGRNGKPFFFSNQGQDMGACLEFLEDALTHDDIKAELLIGGISDLSKIDKYINVVERTREELKFYIKNIGNLVVKQKSGILR